MPRAGQSAVNIERIKKAYGFLTDRERNGRTFTPNEVAAFAARSICSYSERPRTTPVRHLFRTQKPIRLVQ